MEALKAAAKNADKEEIDEKRSFKVLLSKSIEDALDRVNNGGIDSFDMGLWIISNLTILADHEGYKLEETTSFLESLFD